MKVLRWMPPSRAKLASCKPGNHPENSGLRAVLHLGLEADDVVERAQLVVAAQLHHRIGLHIRPVRVGQPHRLHRAEAQRLAPAFGHHLDRQAAVEIACRLAFVELGLVGGEKRVDEGLVLRRGPSGSSCRRSVPRPSRPCRSATASRPRTCRRFRHRRWGRWRRRRPAPRPPSRRGCCRPARPRSADRWR